MSDITITIWNGNGLAKETINMLTDAFTDSTLPFITETWPHSTLLYPTHWTQFHNYGKLVNHSTRGQDDIALLVNPARQHSVSILPSSSSYLLSCQISDTLIHCVYHPPSLPADVFSSFLSSIPLCTHPSQHHAIIWGDFNARSTQLLGDSRSNTPGMVLFDWIQMNQLICWNTHFAFGQHT
ncbi:hypothetical protein BCR43DRAFT_432987, partial [Syncephalastrum racemosum]